ncbi:uncharacterized protein VTP21DRAFT_5110 [Calcarisporiella thermophila]|uniref:uncharacterized protein n=1 Tax=Calcarisporiella thermophila TaxID=911321 RepID=UPI0037430ADA
MTVPKLQWLSLPDQSIMPLPRRDFAMAHISKYSLVILFGGRTSDGQILSDTWIFEVNTYIWRKPNSYSANNESPPARCCMAFGSDSTKNDYQYNLAIALGQGIGEKALSDVWIFNLVYERWYQLKISPGESPSPRWGVASGIDISKTNNENQTLYISHGTDGKELFTDTWGLTISGSYVYEAQNMLATWKKVDVQGPTPSGRHDSAGTVVTDNRLMLYGGCNTSDTNTCALQDGYAIHIIDYSGQWHPFSLCNAPRFGASMAQNPSVNAPQFATQSFVFGGAGLSSLGNGQPGEIAVVDAEGGTWNILIPSFDPLSSKKYPTRRVGAGLIPIKPEIQDARKGAVNLLLFGGEELDETGQTTSRFPKDTWMLRIYGENADPMQSNTGTPTTGGVNATGEGVSVAFLKCVSISQENGSGSTTPKIPPLSTPNGSKTPEGAFSTDPSLIRHVILISVACIAAPFAISLARFPTKQTYTAGFILLYSGALGTSIAGLHGPSLSDLQNPPLEILRFPIELALVIFAIGFVPLFMIIPQVHWWRSKSDKSLMPQKPFEVLRPARSLRSPVLEEEDNNANSATREREYQEGNVLATADGRRRRETLSSGGAIDSVMWEDKFNPSSASSRYSSTFRGSSSLSTNEIAPQWVILFQLVARWLGSIALVLLVSFESFILYTLPTSLRFLFYVYLIAMLFLLLGWVVAAWYGYPNGSVLVRILSRYNGRSKYAGARRRDEIKSLDGPYTRRGYIGPRRGYLSGESNRDGYSDENIDEEGEVYEGVENEMNNREVVVMTIPKRRLAVVNA